MKINAPRFLLLAALPGLLAEHFCLQHGGEGLPVQELVAKAAVEAFAAGVLPWAAGLEVERLAAAPCDPLPHRQRHALGAVVAADELRRAPAAEAEGKSGGW